MRQRFFHGLTLIAFLTPFPIIAQQAETDPLAQYAWVSRPLVIFADTPEDPRYIRQMDLLKADPEALAERDIVVLTDTDPAAESALRERLRPRDFMLVMIDKDSNVVFRKPTPWSVREISRSIDKTPMRIDEMNEKLGK